MKEEKIRKLVRDELHSELTKFFNQDRTPDCISKEDYYVTLRKSLYSVMNDLIKNTAYDVCLSIATETIQTQLGEFRKDMNRESFIDDIVSRIKRKQLK